MFRIQRILIFACILVLCQSQFSQERRNNYNKKLSITLIYETLCRDSINFISRQLGRVHDELKDLIDVQLVPFGKSYSEDNGAEFYCQHGPDECKGNRKHSCVLAQTLDQTAQVNFAVCAMSQSEEYFDSCVESAGLNADIEQCMNAEEGTQLQLKAERITEHYKPQFVPTIIYDNVFDQKLQDNSIRNFRQTVCLELGKRGLVDFTEEGGPCT